MYLIMFASSLQATREVGMVAVRDVVDDAGEVGDVDHPQYQAISRVKLTVFPLPCRYR